MPTESRSVRYWSLVLSVLLLCDIAPSIPIIVRDHAILRHPKETFEHLLTSEPDEKGLVYYTYEAGRETFGGSYKPKESSLPYIRTGEAITVTYSDRELWKYVLGHELRDEARMYVVFNSMEFILAAGLLGITFPNKRIKDPVGVADLRPTH